VGCICHQFYCEARVCVYHPSVLTVIAVLPQAAPQLLFSVWLNLTNCVRCRWCVSLRKLMNWDEEAAEVTETVDGTTFGFF
jgi:hypothetical protein